MIATILSLILFIVFSILSLIHFNWCFGGEWGLKKVIPTKENESSILEIPKFATLMVAIVLFFFGQMYLIKSGLGILHMSNLITKYGYWIVPSIFMLRAIGDFKYVGFFKKIKNTEFGKSDSKLFAPLCLAIGICGFLIQFLSY